METSIEEDRKSVMKGQILPLCQRAFGLDVLVESIRELGGGTFRCHAYRDSIHLGNQTSR